MDLKSFSPPDYSLIDDDPLTFKRQFQAFVDALTKHESDAGNLQRTVDELHAALDGSARNLQESEQLAQQHQEAAKQMESQHKLAVAAYRQARLNGDPTIPPELVEGQTVQDIDVALEKAHGVVEYVRDKVMTAKGEGDLGATTAPTRPPHVPAGAPGRTLPDTSTMTSREKLIFGTSMQPAR